ncbi:MAG: hypothetical protein ACR5K4_03755 [Sodalis sp. (in: enterobacteria)]
MRSPSVATPNTLEGYVLGVPSDEKLTKILLLSCLSWPEDFIKATPDCITYVIVHSVIETFIGKTIQNMQRLAPAALQVCLPDTIKKSSKNYR